MQLNVFQATYYICALNYNYLANLVRTLFNFDELVQVKKCNAILVQM